MCSDRRKNHGCGQKKQKTLAVLYMASGRLRNAANSSVVPTEFAAEPTTKMKSSSSWREIAGWLPKTTPRFPAKKRRHSPQPVGFLETTLTLPESLYGQTYVRKYADVRTKFSHIDRLSSLLNNGALLASYARGLSYYCSLEK